MFSCDTSIHAIHIGAGFPRLRLDHGVGSTDHFSVLKIWMFKNKFVSLPSHLKTIEPMARPIREKSGTGVYHVMLRGINRQDIFEDEEEMLISALSFGAGIRQLSRLTGVSFGVIQKLQK